MSDTEKSVELTYDLFSLPTAQHKAGLAGVWLLCESMRRRKLTPLPGIALSADGTVRLTLTEQTLRALFDDLYDAAWEEVESRRKRKDRQKNELPPLREETRTEPNRKTGKEKEIRLFIYRDIVPKAAFLSAFDMPDLWVQLWRRAVWATLRGKPLSRTPYNERANHKPLNEAKKTWASLLKFDRARAKGELVVDEVASSLFLGAQAENAEKVPFCGRVDENFLLHFWPAVMRVYVPEVIDNEGASANRGYVIAIPEVTDIEGFVEEYKAMLATLKEDMRRFLPADSIISVPQEGALEYMLTIAKSRAEKGDIAYSLAAVEVIHLEKRGDNVHMLSAGRVPLSSSVLESYEAIRGKFRHPQFKSQIILNLLRGREWYHGFDTIFLKGDKERFIGNRTAFSRDVRRQLDTRLQ